jgi:hypothetical protein
MHINAWNEYFVNQFIDYHAHELLAWLCSIAYALIFTTLHNFSHVLVVFHTSQLFVIHLA